MMQGAGANTSGQIYDLRLKIYGTTVKSHAAEYFTFRWDYRTGESKPETAYVQIWRVHKENKVTFECAILYRDFKLITLSGDILSPVKDVAGAYKPKPDLVTRINK